MLPRLMSKPTVPSTEARVRPHDRSIRKTVFCIASRSAHKYLYQYSASAAVAHITALRYASFPRIAPARAALLRH